MSGSYLGQQLTANAGNDFLAETANIQRLLARVETAALVIVKACTNSGGITPVGKVDVQKLVHQVDGSGSITPHAVIYGLPYLRVQGGANAVIIDPQVGDIGVAVFCSRDSSTAVNTKGMAPPGSRRRHDPSDGMYIGGLLNGTPTQYLQFSSTGITAVSPTKITLQAPTTAIQGNLTVSGTTTGQGDAVFAGTDVHKHVHTNAGGSGNSGPPA